MLAGSRRCPGWPLQCSPAGSPAHSLLAPLCRQGEVFDRTRHTSGTEVKAITYSAMQINEAPGDAEIFVIVDI